MPNNPNLDLKSKIFFSIAAIVTLSVLYFIYDRFEVRRDYMVYVHAECDPAIESCFVGECFPEEDPRCMGLNERVYKVIVKKAYQFPPTECQIGDVSCTAYLCSEESQATLEISDPCSQGNTQPIE